MLFQGTGLALSGHIELSQPVVPAGASGGRAIPDLENIPRSRAPLAAALAARYLPLRLLAVFASVLIWTPFTGGFAAWPIEAGAVEWHSFVILILCAPAFLGAMPWRLWARYVHVPVGALLLAMREGESDWWIIDARLLNPAFYQDEGLTLTALAGGAIALLVLASMCTLVIFGLPALWRGLRARRTWAVLLGLAGAFAIAGQLVEEVLMQPLAAIGGQWFAEICEEIPELIFAILLFEAILAAAPTTPRAAVPQPVR